MVIGHHRNRDTIKEVTQVANISTSSAELTESIAANGITSITLVPATFHGLFRGKNGKVDIGRCLG